MHDYLIKVFTTSQSQQRTKIKSSNSAYEAVTTLDLQEFHVIMRLATNLKQPHRYLLLAENYSLAILNLHRCPFHRLTRNVEW